MALNSCSSFLFILLHHVPQLSARLMDHPTSKPRMTMTSDQDELHSRSGEGHGSPLQCSCLENPRDGRAWRAALYGVAQSRTRLKRLSSDSSSIPDHHTRIKAVRISPQSTCCVICLHFITVARAIPELWDCPTERWSGTWPWGNNTMHFQILVLNALPDPSVQCTSRS